MFLPPTVVTSEYERKRNHTGVCPGLGPSFSVDRDQEIAGGGAKASFVTVIV